MAPDVNLLAVLLATLSTLVIGSVWYNPKVFGTRWTQWARIEPGSQGSLLVQVLVTLVVSAITAWVLAGATFIAQQFYGGSFLGNAVVTGLFLWGGFTAARFAANDAFEGRPPQLTLLTMAHELVTVLVMALIIGLFGV